MRSGLGMLRSLPVKSISKGEIDWKAPKVTDSLKDGRTLIPHPLVSACPLVPTVATALCLSNQIGDSDVFGLNWSVFK